MALGLWWTETTVVGPGGKGENKVVVWRKLHRWADIHERLQVRHWNPVFRQHGKLPQTPLRAAVRSGEVDVVESRDIEGKWLIKRVDFAAEWTNKTKIERASNCVPHGLRRESSTKGRGALVLRIERVRHRNSASQSRGDRLSEDCGARKDKEENLACSHRDIVATMGTLRLRPIGL